MVRTAATAVRTGGAKSAKGAATLGGGSSSAPKSRRNYIGGNKPINRPIPGWQKPISNFFGRNENVVIQPRTFDENEEQEEEVNILEPPDWQKPVSDFLTSAGSTKKHDKEESASEDSNPDRIDLEESGCSKTLVHDNKKDEPEKEPCSSGESSKRMLDDTDDGENPPKRTRPPIDNEDEDENPPKCTSPPIDYKLLEEYENC